jgi:hypothetical protein
MVDRQQIVAALVAGATVLFLASGASWFRYRRPARIAALAVYAVALVAVLIWIGMWLTGTDIRR